MDVSKLPSGEGRDELNWAEFPMAVLDPKQQNSTAVFRDRFFDKGHWVDRSVTVTASELYGLPGPTDDDVLLACLQLTRVANFKSPTIEFSRYELASLLGWVRTGPNYKRLDESLKRWTGVMYDYTNAWWLQDARKWASVTFTPINDLYLTSSRTERCHFRWSDTVFASFQAGCLKTIDFDFLMSLSHPIAKRIYRYLSKQAYRSSERSFDLREFCCGHVGFGEDVETRQLKKRIAPSLNELEHRGFLAPSDNRYTKLINGQWQILLGLATTAPPDEDEGIERLLVVRGVSEAAAARLVADHDAELISQKIAELDWLMTTRKIDNPGGYLVQSIQEGWATPKGYAQAGREKEVKEAAAARAEKERKAREAAEQAEKAKRAAERRHVDRALAGMTEPDRHLLEEEALRNATGAELEAIRRGPDSAVGQAARFAVISREVLRRHPLPVQGELFSG
jgi:hypothetical protein